MAKKSSKHQSKPANTTTTEINKPLFEGSAPAKTTVTPTASPPISVTPPTPYKPITDEVSIERLVGLAKDSPPDSALCIVWKYAYDEGYQNGRKEVLQNLGRKLEEKFREGEKEGIVKGREKYYGKGIVLGESEEHKRWKAAGHGQWCFVPAGAQDCTGTQTDPPVTSTTSVSTQTNPTTFAVTSQSPAPSENGQNTKTHPISEISAKLPIFSSPTLSTTTLNPAAHSKTNTASETQLTTAIFMKSHPKIKKSPTSTQTTPIPLTHNTTGPINDVTRANTSPKTPNDVVLQPPTLPTTASSLQPPPSIGHQKIDILRTVFESERHTESPEPTTIVPALKTRSATADFTENCKKLEKLPQNHSESLVSTCFYWADDANELPTSSIEPTKCPRDLSSLCSSNFLKNPFSSLQRRHRKFNKKRSHLFNSKHQYYCHHIFPAHYSHSQKLHHQFRPPLSASLNWDQDPRLFDLSNILKALGWIRR